MPRNGEGEILEWLGGQKGAMLTLLEDIVNIDGGSYDKAGVDAVGDAHPQISRRATRSPARPSRTRNSATRCARPSAARRIPRSCCSGHRDTVFPKGEPTRRPFKIENGKAYGPGRRRHEGRAGDERLRARGIQEIRRRARAAGRAVHLRRGDRLARLPPDHRGGGEARARGVQLRAGAAERQCRHRPQGRRVHEDGGHRQGRAFGRQLRRGHQRDRGARAQDHRAARDHRPHQGHDRQRRAHLRRADRQHGRALGEMRDRPALRHAAGPRGRDGARSRASSRPRTCRARSARLEIAGEFKPLVEGPENKRLFDHYAACANDLALKVEGEFTGGCADSGFTSGVGTPTICAVGPVGGKAHTPEEFLWSISLVPRAQTLALAVARLT